ncbi:protein kinase domain-containing protein [Chamaesiphon sp. VAR_48_metabat_403]|uniref:protein kinase domain-containing protein n=1 Tax=Chamaesiphon sp. VAR_48_metabat_403 TaxID=2964700 RepID=UPI00286E9221|nr:ankyrin repeat domain-containing protein [Chamaesiphon sp. VAR_48_metabat_403]
MESAKIPIGSTLDERYELIELLGEGGSGSTYKAIRLADRVIVAIKMLSLRHLNDWKQLELFEREAKVLSQLNHPQIPQYLEYFHIDTPDNRAFYIVQQLAPGRPLTEWVQSGWRGTEAEIRDIASQLLAILQYLHHQSPPLIHRDLKPHNIIRDDDGRIFLVDFGAVQDVYNNTLLKGSTVAGTYGYMAPEQFRGDAVRASDLYGLGATILYLLTHRSPADLPQERLKLNFRSHVNISNHFADWLETMLEPDTSARFSSARVALSNLEKQHWFSKRRNTKFNSSWINVAVATIILSISVPLIYEYRHTVAARIGLPVTDICYAIRNDDVESLHRYLDRGVSVNATVEINQGWDSEESRSNGYFVNGSMLDCAIEHRKDEIVADLLKHGADPNLGNNYSTPLHRIVNFSYSCAEEGDSYCLAHGFKIVDYLLNYQAKIDAEDRDRNTPLAIAIKANNNDLAKFLISKGADVNKVSSNDSSPLILAIDNNEKDNLELVKILLVKGADPNIPNDNGETPLMRAIFYADGHLTRTSDATLLKTIELLLSKGADPNLVDRDGNTALHYLAKLDNINYQCINNKSLAARIFDLLIQYRVDRKAIVNKEGNTALHVLADKKDLHPIVDRMIESGWDPLKKNRGGKNALELKKAAKSISSECERQVEPNE